jgi:hypothetical protein
MTLLTSCTFWLVMDVLRGSRSAPRSGHDVTGPDINLDFPDSQVGGETGLGSCHVAPDRRPTEKQALAGELARFTALGTHIACQSRWDRSTCAGLAARTLARLAIFATATSKRVETDHVIAYRANTWYNLICMSSPCIYTGLYTYITAPSLASPWIHEKELNY